MTELVSVGVGVALGLTAAGRTLVEKAFGPAADEIGQRIRDRVQSYLDGNRTIVVNEAAEMLRSAQGSVHQIPLRTLAPLLEAAGREDQIELQRRWAALLANAAIAGDGGSIPPLFASILSNLTPEAARVLEALKVGPGRGGILGRGTTIADLARHAGLSSDRSELAVDILISQGVALRNQVDNSPDNVFRTIRMEIFITALGKRFIAACTPPTNPASTPQAT